MKRWLTVIGLLAVPMVVVELLAQHLIRLPIIAGAFAQHVPSSGPAQMRPELDNESITVLRIRLAPHEKTGMHEVSARLVIWLTDAHLRDTAEDGKTIDYDRTPGAVDWVPTRRHAGENLGENPIEFLAVVPKQTALVPRAVEHLE
jgi:hypothetical protein